eukprot:TRINITY_DN4811_c0_g1_i1.p2 TRINITY_DN4811_c0_g1~~TRINITY_DN4811_c0_g1_i1.p2  ORF type:complete len:272 (+),score=5.08 TRINITY_DN4811_c0_g1_i1:206-1021(+)
MSYLGSVAAKTVSIVIYVGALSIYLWVSGRCSNTLVRVNTDAFKGWKEYLALAIPTTLMVCLEWWTWEILNLLCGKLGIAELAANTILISIAMLTNVIGCGLGAASGTLVGNSIGENKLVKAKTFTSTGVSLIIIGVTLEYAFVLLFRRELAMLFTSEEEVIEIIDGLMYVFAVRQLADLIQTVMGRIIIATGEQAAASIANLVCYYIIMLPSAIVLGLWTDLGIYGIQVGCLMGSVSIMVWYGWLLWTTDWEKTVINAYKRIEDGKNARQ